MNRKEPTPSHWWPRTRGGQLALIAFVALMALAQPPVVGLANRIEPTILGLPFLYAWLLGIYLALAALLVIVWCRGI